MKEQQTPRDRVLWALGSFNGQLSMTRLRQQTDLTKAELDPVLEDLEKENKIAIRRKMVLLMIIPNRCAMTSLRIKRSGDKAMISPSLEISLSNYRYGRGEHHSKPIGILGELIIPSQQKTSA
jgi:predicted Zn-ribbon and HTH transcriptional regulator